MTTFAKLTHKRTVATNLANFTSSNAGVTAKLINTTIPFQTVIDDPTAYGAANATCYDDDGTTCVWWNNYHPALASKFSSAGCICIKASEP